MMEAQLRALEAELVAEGVASFETKPALPVHWVASRTLFQRGFPLEGPAVSFEKGNSLITSGWDILQALDPLSVTIQDDEEWYHFPEIGVAYQKMTEIENYFAVACSSHFCKWGVGFGNGKKGRESAARLALAVAIAVGSPQLNAFEKQFPGFASLCSVPSDSGYGNNASSGLAQASTTGRGYNVTGESSSQVSHFFAETPTTRRSNLAHDFVEIPTAGEAAGAQAAPPQIYWLSLREDSKLVQQGWPAQVPAIIHDRSQQPFFSIAAPLLDDVLGQRSANFYHEAAWERFPEIRDALKLAMGPKASEYSFCVATCNELNKWAYGLAWGKKTMEVAAKLALAYQLALTSGRMDELMRNYPEFEQLVQASAGDCEGPSTKRPRLGLA